MANLEPLTPTDMKLAYCTPTSCGPTSYRNGLEALFRSPLAGFTSLSPYLDFRAAASTPRLAMDVYENEAAYTTVMELPGVKKEDVKLDLSQRSLTVTAERKLTTDSGESTQSYTRSLTLPADVATDSISAKLEDGILTLTLPKAAEARSRSISIA